MAPLPQLHLPRRTLQILGRAGRKLMLLDLQSGTIQLL
jgi:hypothetical protein